MTTRTYAGWVEPIAAQYRETRRELVELARALPADVWSRPSPLPAWTYKDLLAHIAGDTGKNALRLLRSVAVDRRADQSLFDQMGRDVESRNARDVAERRERSVDQLVGEIEADAEEWQDLLARFGEEDRDLRQEGIPWSLGEALSRNPDGHDREHLEHLRTAVLK